MSDLVEPAQLPLLNSLAGLSFYTQYLNVAPPPGLYPDLANPPQKEEATGTKSSIICSPLFSASRLHAKQLTRSNNSALLSPCQGPR